jgi:hypothetical protein
MLSARTSHVLRTTTRARVVARVRPDQTPSYEASEQLSKGPPDGHGRKRPLLLCGQGFQVDCAVYGKILKVGDDSEGAKISFFSVRK